MTKITNLCYDNIDDNKRPGEDRNKTVKSLSQSSTQCIRIHCIAAVEYIIADEHKKDSGMHWTYEYIAALHYSSRGTQRSKKNTLEKKNVSAVQCLSCTLALL